MGTMLTTVDNPWSPFTQFDEWYAFDEQAGYHSLAVLARIAKVTDDMSESNLSVAIENAIDEIVEINAIGVWRKVTESGEPEVFNEVM